MDLSNYVFIRTRERLLLENKVKEPHRVNKSGKVNKLSAQFSEKSLTNVNQDLKESIAQLQNMLYVLLPSQPGAKLPDLPVAFATNTLYVLERNGAGAVTRDAYENLLLPVIRNKAEYLHAEGVAQAVWALSNAEIVDDSALWGKLKQLVVEKDFTPVIVKNERWSATLYQTTSGSEHFFQSELSEFADNLFFKDHINLFEAYNGLLKANSLNKELGLDSAIKHLETKYGDILLRKNEQFREIEATHSEAVFAQQVQHKSIEGQY
jgi:hypothetical protein